MGSWNGTCALSQLPIENGDNIKLILLKNKLGLDELKLFGGYEYHDDYFKPQYLPISAEYEDYGRIKNPVIDSNYNLIEKSLKKQLGNTIEISDKKYNNFEYDLQLIILGIERGKLKYVGVDKDQVKAQKFAKFMYDSIPEDVLLEKKDVAESLLAKMNVDVSHRERIFDMTFIMIREDIWDHIVKYNNECGVLEDTDDVSQYLNDSGAKITRSAAYYKLLKTASENVKNEIHSIWCEFTSVDLFMALSRKGYMPQAGKGASTKVLNLHKMLAEKIIEICDENQEE